MTPKEKASQLVQDYLLILSWVIEPHRLQKSAELCALRAVDEKIETLDKIKSVIDCFDLRDFYLEVKQEIEKR